jgi:hypothetical protein
MNVEDHGHGTARIEAATARILTSSGCSSYLDNGQMRPVLESADDQPHTSAAFALDPHHGTGAPTFPRPA